MTDPIDVSLRTQRFASFLATMAVLAGLSAFAIWFHADVGLTTAVLSALAGFGATYQVAGAFHDTAIRKALIDAPSDAP